MITGLRRLVLLIAILLCALPAQAEPVRLDAGDSMRRVSRDAHVIVDQQGRLSFDEAIHEAKMKGAGNATMRRLEENRRWLADPEREEDIAAATTEEKSAIKFNLAKLRDRADALLRKHFKV